MNRRAYDQATNANQPDELASKRDWLRPLRHWSAAWIVLAFSSLLTMAAWYVFESAVNRSVVDRLNARVAAIELAISRRMKSQENALRAGVGLFAAEETVNRKQWRSFVQTLQLERNFPGLLGYGFSLLIRPQDLAAHIQDVRDAGFAPYNVWPAGQRAIYTSIIYLEPFEGRNLRAFGYDMFSEPTRRAAMERARDGGTAAVSGMITLVQETDKDVQRGFLMYLPVYRGGALPQTIEARRESLMGYVYSPFRINDLMKGILGGATDIGFKIFDAPTAMADRILYDSHGDARLADVQRSRFQSTRVMTIGGHDWTVLYYAGADFQQAAEAAQPFYFAAGGALINILLFLVIGSIATQQKRAERIARDMTQGLHEASIRTRAIVEAVVEGVITINERDIIESFNPAAEQIFQYSAAEVIGQNVKLLIPEPDHSRYDGYLEACCRGGPTGIIGKGREVVGRRKDGTVFPMDLGVSEMWLGANRLFVGTVRDITERKQVERLKNEFVSVVSHELRTPLTSIRGSLGLVAGGVAGELAPKARELVRIAYKNCERLTALINDILDIAKIESGTSQFNMRPQALMPLVEQAIEANLQYARQLNVELEVGSAARDIVVSVDADRFMQVMTNLISNAAKFSPARGRVEISLAPHDGMARVSVRDHGGGIAPEFQQRIFQRFSQADSSSSRARSGSGLGLSISKAIVEQMNGEIGFETAVGQGTVFHVDLPLWVELPTAVEERNAGSAPCVLVCEDDSDVGRLIAMLLTSNGFNVEVAASAAAASRMLGERSYAAMTLDLALPDRDGIAFIRELRGHPNTYDLPIIVVSADVEGGRAQINGGFGVLDWLSKPIDQNRLLAALNRGLKGRRNVPGPAGSKPRVLHVEDDADVGSVVKSMAGDVAEFDLVGTLSEARIKLRTNRYRLVILDLTLPDGIGWELLNSMNEMADPPVVLVFSATDVGAAEAKRVAAALVKSRTSNDELLATLKNLLHCETDTRSTRAA
jgi:PAS domain S-box-containing protein